jgi:inositol polyphosphate 5-phosphatase INPP5A
MIKQRVDFWSVSKKKNLFFFQLRQFDHELKPLEDLLFEFEIKFPPSYPYEEDPQMPDSYMFTRCPGWCDRILLSPAAKVLLEENDDDIRKIYGIIGENICMGDHKVSVSF